MQNAPFRLKVYVWALAIAAGLIVSGSLRSLRLTPAHLIPIATVSVLVALADIFPVVLRKGESEITISTAFRIASAMLFPFPLPIFMALFGTLSAEIALRRHWFKALFNTSMMVILYATLLFLFTAIGDHDPVPLNTSADLAAFVTMLSADYLLNVGMVSFVIAFASRMPISYSWRLNFRDISMSYVLSAPLGAAFAVLWRLHPITIVLVMVPLVVVRQSFKLTSDLRTQTEEALLGLADALDARDTTTSRHSARVSDYARRLALRMKVPAGELGTITWAARLHDLGKIGISDRWLYKPAALTPQEVEEFRRHVEIGADIAERFPVFGKGSGLIRAHHEHYNGQGYPAGLSVEDTPLGARIIAVADAFDAMTSDRPYRKALTPEQALQTLCDESGKQFDPQVVESFVQMIQLENDLPLTPPRVAG